MPALDLTPAAAWTHAGRRLLISARPATGTREVWAPPFRVMHAAAVRDAIPCAPEHIAADEVAGGLALGGHRLLERWIAAPDVPVAVWEIGGRRASRGGRVDSGSAPGMALSGGLVRRSGLRAAADGLALRSSRPAGRGRSSSLPAAARGGGGGSRRARRPGAVHRDDPAPNRRRGGDGSGRARALGRGCSRGRGRGARGGARPEGGAARSLRHAFESPESCSRAASRGPASGVTRPSSACRGSADRCSPPARASAGEDAWCFGAAACAAAAAQLIAGNRDPARELLKFLAQAQRADGGNSAYCRSAGWPRCRPRGHDRVSRAGRTVPGMDGGSRGARRQREPFRRAAYTWPPATM